MVVILHVLAHFSIVFHLMIIKISYLLVFFLQITTWANQRRGRQQKNVSAVKQRRSDFFFYTFLGRTTRLTGKLPRNDDRLRRILGNGPFDDERIHHHRLCIYRHRLVAKCWPLQSPWLKHWPLIYIFRRSRGLTEYNEPSF